MGPMYCFHLFIGCTGSSLLPWAFSGRTVRASHCGSSHGGAQALGPMGFSKLWFTSLAAPWHMESSWTRDGTRVPGIGGWILIHFATREVLYCGYYY